MRLWGRGHHRRALKCPATQTKSLRDCSFCSRQHVDSPFDAFDGAAPALLPAARPQSRRDFARVAGHFNARRWRWLTHNARFSWATLWTCRCSRWTGRSGRSPRRSGRWACRGGRSPRRSGRWTGRSGRSPRPSSRVPRASALSGSPAVRGDHFVLGAGPPLVRRV
jgi:hypothetical protein